MLGTQIGRLTRSEEAATAAEYAVMLGLIVFVLISVIMSLGSSTAGFWQNDATQITNAISGS
jgi:Flp pilus assembly pilin Flp